MTRAVPAQPDLFSARPPIRVADRHVTRAEKPRLSAQSAAILRRLEAGPCDNGELATIAIRYSARLYDLKRAGYAWHIAERDYASGRVVYALGEA